MITIGNVLKGTALSCAVLTVAAMAADPKINIPGAQTNPKAQKSSAALNAAPKYKRGEVIVKYKKGISLKQVQQTLSSKASLLGDIKTNTFKALSKKSNAVMVHVKSKMLSTEELIKKFKADPNVEYVEPNYLYHPEMTPNDPMFDQLWGQNNTGQTINGTTGTVDADIDAPEAWDKDTGSANVVIAVIDTGVDYLHEDLKDNMWVNPGEIPNNGIDDDNNGYVDDVHGINAINDSGDPMDVVAEDGGHGTHVAGTIAAVGNNGVGVVGVSWHTKIMACKFLGVGGGTTSDAIKCLDYVVDQKNKGVNIVATNNSWGGGGSSDAMKDAIQASNDAGIVFVAAAGNDGSDNDSTPSYPASYDLPGIMAVAATDQDDNLASFSNYGATSVDLSAPGTNILSSTPRAYVPQPGDIFFDDMEGDFSNWTTGGTNNTWAISDDQEGFADNSFPVPSPTHFLSDSPGAEYQPNTDSWIMVNHDIDLSSVSDDVYLGFGSAEYIENSYDHAKVEISSDGGTTWTELFDFSGYAYYWQNPYDYKIPDDFKTAHFRFRFHLTSDDSVQYDGWLIDNVGIGTRLSPTYQYFQGTSMATPQVSGAVSLLASKCRNDSGIELQQIILNNVDPKDSLTGKVATGGRLNIANAMDANCTHPVHNFVLPYLLFW